MGSSPSESTIYIVTKQIAVKIVTTIIATGSRFALIESGLSCALLNRVTYYELNILRRRVRSVLNRLSTDDLYASDGSQPPRNKEILQTWDAIKALNQALVSAEEEESLRRCAKAIETALDTYALISCKPWP
jgi:hypothetical protein